LLFIIYEKKVYIFFKIKIFIILYFICFNFHLFLNYLIKIKTDTHQKYTLFDNNNNDKYKFLFIKWDKYNQTTSTRLIAISTLLYKRSWILIKPQLCNYLLVQWRRHLKYWIDSFCNYNLQEITIGIQR